LEGIFSEEEGETSLYVQKGEALDLKMGKQGGADDFSPTDSSQSYTL